MKMKEKEDRKAAEEAALMIMIAPSGAKPPMKKGSTCPHCGASMKDEGKEIEDDEEG